MSRTRCLQTFVTLLLISASLAGARADSTAAGTHALAQSPSSAIAAALSGTVSSASEGKMEGVLVSAEKNGSPNRITVVSNASGHFDFPADRLSPGHYELSIRAIGYELDGPRSADVPASGIGTTDLILRKSDDIAAQMTNTEWFMSIPGTAAQKQKLLACMSCHTLGPIVRSTLTSDEFVPVLKRMANYAENTTEAVAQPRPTEQHGSELLIRRIADYLASNNLSRGSTWAYPLKTLPRPTGAATRTIVTEYSLPRKAIAPHDVRTDSEGNVWYSDFVEEKLGMLDPQSGTVKECDYPVVKPGFPMGSLDLEPDQDGNLWFAMLFQTGLAK
ncbi:MAG TPA: carboxypeptidase regulatory-like domain-containing protein, partial [Beijerinckiaceae bacterium]|nr:carboxypeptidase regulatory-like domain-containing protein [Beijerinckiaceae bacterium]